MNILFWDIDGTLIRTFRAGLIAFDQAVQELWGKSVSYDDIKTAGMTDLHIATELIRRLAGREPEQQEAEALVSCYEKYLPGQVAARGGVIMPAVVEILQDLAKRNDYRLLLLTGNTGVGAEIKLKYFNLDQYFDFSQSAFCCNSKNRNDIAAAALKTVQQNYGGCEPLHYFVIGDTPNDIRCGKSIGAHTIAVATGHYTAPELSEHTPWWAVETLPSPAEFAAKIATVK